MGQKIHPLTFRQCSNFKTTFDINLSALKIRQRFQQELELRRLFFQFFSTNKVLSQDILIEQSLRSGFLVRVKILAFKNLTTMLAPFQEKKTSSKNLNKVFSPKTQKRFLLRRVRGNFLDFSSLTKKKIFLKNKINLKTKALMTTPSSRTGTWFPVCFLFTSPALRFLSNKKFLRLFLLLSRALYRFRTQKKYVLLILLGLLSSSSGNWSFLISSLVSGSFFRTRKHMPIFRFYKKLFSSSFILNRSFSEVAGLNFSVAGRFDKRPRAKLYKLSQGNLLKQQIKGEVNYSASHGVTKNGVFGIKFFTRLK